jgi:hypothetical protein
MAVDYDAARMFLERLFREVEDEILSGREPPAPNQTQRSFDTIFESHTQAYREALLGCCLARLQDRAINIRLPYVNQGQGAFNGRTLDERVVNPFLQRNRIPSSRGPYLGVFRRSVRFDQNTRAGVRDRIGYDALLDLVSFLERTEDDKGLERFSRYLLFRFARLRESHSIPLSRLQRISLEQYDTFISGLLETPSGDRLPVLMVVAAFSAMKDFFNLDWAIEYQGINVADAAAGAGGDITISRVGQVLLAAEVTERPIDKDRVAATFHTKIAPSGIEDYLFFVRVAGVAPEGAPAGPAVFHSGT